MYEISNCMHQSDHQPRVWQMETTQEGWWLETGAGLRAERR